MVSEFETEPKIFMDLHTICHYSVEQRTRGKVKRFDAVCVEVATNILDGVMHAVSLTINRFSVLALRIALVIFLIFGALHETPCVCTIEIGYCPNEVH